MKYTPIIVISLIIGFSIALLLKGVVMIDFNNIELSTFDKYLTMGCNSSDSMGLVINCNDRLYLTNVSRYPNLQIGSIYIYRSGNITIVHRLVKCVDKDCNVTIFKGDNNPVAEFINKSQILYKVEMVYYP